MVGQARRPLLKEEKEIQSLQDTVTELQEEIDSLKSTQPHLVVDYFSEIRHIAPSQNQPVQLSDKLPAFTPDLEIVSLALLRVANRPENLNKDAPAYNIYAWISYCDSQWNRLFPNLPRVWVILEKENDPFELGGLAPQLPPLKPHDIAFLRIAIGELFLDKTSLNSPMIYGAVTRLSHQWPAWIHSDFLLSERCTGENIHVKVIIGCHGYKSTYYYILKEKGAGNNLAMNGLIPEPIQPPQC